MCPAPMSPMVVMELYLVDPMGLTQVAPVQLSHKPSDQEPNHDFARSCPKVGGQSRALTRPWVEPISMDCFSLFRANGLKPGTPKPALLSVPVRFGGLDLDRP